MVVSKARYHYELINLIILLIQTLQLSSLTDKGNIRCLTSGNLFNLASESFWYNPSCLITSLLLSITKTFQAYLINILLRNGISRWQIWALGMLIAMRLIIFFSGLFRGQSLGEWWGEDIYGKIPHDLILASNSNQVPWGFIVHQSLYLYFLSSTLRILIFKDTR